MEPAVSKPFVSYRGDDAGEMYVRKLQEEAELLFQEYIATPQQLLALNEAELRSFHTAINCHMQPAAGRGQRVIIVTLWATIGLMCIVGVI